MARRSPEGRRSRWPRPGSESMTTSSGADSTTALMTAPMSVADRIRRPGGTGPRRSARSRTWWADSSAETSSTRCPAAARAARTWRSRVDLPMPGSPPRRVTEPGTSPPDSTRSNSSTPVGRATASETSTDDSGTGIDDRSRASTAETSGPSWASSTRVFHSPHEGQRPAHRAVVDPQSMQRWRLAVFAMGPMVRTGCANRGDRQPLLGQGRLRAGDLSQPTSRRRPAPPAEARCPRWR